MDLNDVNTNNVGNLTEEQRKTLRRQGVKNFASFVMWKIFLFSTIGALSKTVNRRLDAKK